MIDPALQRRGIGRRAYAWRCCLLLAERYHAAFAGIAFAQRRERRTARGGRLITPLGIYREVGWKMGAWRDVVWYQRLL